MLSDGANAKGLQQEFSASAHAVIYSPAGKLLVLIGSEWKERPERSFRPDLPGGGVENGEDLIQGAMREVYEETGLELDAGSAVLAYQDTIVSRYGEGIHLRYFYIAKSRGEDVTLSWEHVDYRWVDVEEFVKTEWRMSQRIAVDFMNQNGLLEQFV